MSDSEERIVLMEMHADKVEQLRQLRTTCAEKDAEIERLNQKFVEEHMLLVDAEARATELDTLMRHWKGEHDAMEARATTAEQERDDQIAAHVVTQKLLNGAIADKAAAEEDALERQSIARELLTKLKAAELERDRFRDSVDAYETRLVLVQDALAAAEQERDTWKAGKELADVTTRELMTKLAAAERREAEKDKLLAACVAVAAGLEMDGILAFKQAKAALASPSTQSHAPSAEPQRFCARCNARLLLATRDGRKYCVNCGTYRWGYQGAPAPSAPREAGAQPERMFPIMGVSIASRVAPIPWAVIAPCEAQAMANHGGQSLEKLASRGGLDPIEAVAVLSGQRCPTKVGDYPAAHAAADKRLRDIVAGVQPEEPQPGYQTVRDTWVTDPEEPKPDTRPWPKEAT
jgi:hypothetical protein